MKKNISKRAGYTLTEVLIVIVGLASIGMVGGGIYVAIHFISKFW